MSVRELRRNRRFNLRLPFELVRTGSTPVFTTGETCNVSSSGVLFRSPAAMEIGQPIEFLITLPTGSEGSAVRLRCLGKVVRQNEIKTEQVPEVAATLERFEFVRTA